jgi:hypothetical protein
MVLTPQSAGTEPSWASVPRIKPEYGLVSAVAAATMANEEDEYFEDVVQHMANMEARTRCDPAMIDSQPELEWHMRPYLLDFLVESHSGLELAPETIFLAVNIIDRYSSKRVIYKRHYQLVGCAALWIASKYTDKKTRIPTLAELKMLCCGAYEEHMFVQMELHILSTLEWTIGHPTADLFVDLHADGNRRGLRSLALYVCELALFHKSLLCFPVSTIAACAVELAGIITTSVVPLSENAATCEMLPGHDSACLELLAEALRWPSTSLQRKYSAASHGEVFQLAQTFVMDMETANAAGSGHIAVTLQQPPHFANHNTGVDDCPHTPAPIVTPINYGYITPPFSDS